MEFSAKQGGNIALAAVVVLVVLAVVGIGGYLSYKYYFNNQGPVACTLEAKICPDGSSVGRTGPDCEFAECPDLTAGWKIYLNNDYGFGLKYPADYEKSDKVESQGYFDYQITKIFGLSAKEENIDLSSFYIYADNSSNNLAVCLKKYNYTNGKKLVDLNQTKDVNGNKFHIVYEKQGDAAMGGARGYISEYRIIHNNYCYVVQSQVYYHIVGYIGEINEGKNSATPAETQAQAAAIEKHEQILDQIFSTFKFTK